MAVSNISFSDDFNSRFKTFHELMAKKVREVLLVSTPYDAWIMEEDCRLSERIINEYKGLNLSHPPRLTWVSSAEEAISAFSRKKFDMVVTMPQIADMDACALGRTVKDIAPDIPVVLLSHDVLPSINCRFGNDNRDDIDRTFVWSGDTDILVALIKSTEDRMNVAADVASAGIRVILLVEDSPAYLSSFLPILYKELVSQTQEVMEGTLNEEHRLLTMRARPKILVAENFEEANSLYEQFEPYVLGIVSDVRFPRNGKMDDNAGVDLLKKVKKQRFDIPMLLSSTDALNARKAADIPAVFVDKNSHSLRQEIRSFFREHLGFGDFVFRMPDGGEIARASSLKSLEKCLMEIPPECFVQHCLRNDFSRWLFARTEIVLASKVRPISDNDFSDVESHRKYLASVIHSRRKRRQKGVVADFDPVDFDFDTEFFKIGKGSLGGKARGLAFVASMLRQHGEFDKKYNNIDIIVPQTLVITTDGFESFVEENNLQYLSTAEVTDQEIANKFTAAHFPKWIEEDLRAYLSKVNYPLAVRSSSLLEDAQFRAYAGLYHTYMIANNCDDLEQRLDRLIKAIKLVYASTYYHGPRAFSKRVGHRTEEEKMAVIIQQLVGEQYGESFYPAVSGVAQSRNYYPFSRMKPEEGIATIALGLGKMVVEGEKTLRFSPAHPNILPQLSIVEDILKNAQRTFYSLSMDDESCDLEINDGANLEKRDIMSASDEHPVKLLASTYIPEEHRIRDTTHVPGHRVLTFSYLLKHRQFPLAEILKDGLEMGTRGMGCPVELEFSINLCKDSGCRPQFAFLQLRPMTARAELIDVKISEEDVKKSFCFSNSALGNVVNNDIKDIIYVKPDAFDPAKTIEIAGEISRFNASLVKSGRKYLLIGPGRWGSADRWLGIPVSWADISGVGAIIETTSDKLRAEPSQGSHFFHNITTLGINYITIAENRGDILDLTSILSSPVAADGKYSAHITLQHPMLLKVDGRSSTSIII